MSTTNDPQSVEKTTPQISFQEIVGASQQSQKTLFMTIFFALSLVLSVVCFANVDVLKVFNSFFNLASSEGIFAALWLKILDLTLFAVYAVVILSVAYNLTVLCFFISSHATTSVLKSYLFQETSSSSFTQRAAEFFAFSGLSQKNVAVSKIAGEHRVYIQHAKSTDSPTANFASKNSVFNLNPINFSSIEPSVFCYFLLSIFLVVLSYKLGTAMVDSKMFLAIVFGLVPLVASIWVRIQYVRLSTKVCKKLAEYAESNTDLGVELHKAMTALMSSTVAPLPKTAFEKKFNFTSCETVFSIALPSAICAGLICFMVDASEIKYESSMDDILAAELVAKGLSSGMSEVKFKVKNTEANALVISPMQRSCGFEKTVKLNEREYCTSAKTPTDFLKDLERKMPRPKQKD